MTVRQPNSDHHTYVGLRMPVSVLEQINAAAGYRGVSKFLRDAAQEKLERDAWLDTALIEQK